MSIATAIQNAQQRVANAYNAIEAKGGTLPTTQNLSNMPTAIASIPSGGTATIDPLSITPTTSQQVISATSGVDGYAPITVAAVTSAIDNNIVATNIKSGASILGVNGSVVELQGETRTVTPTTSQQTITPTSGKNGITSVTVNAVTSSIDNNITSGNIKKDVTILGVTGTYEGSGGSGIPREKSGNSYGYPSTSFSFSFPSGVTSIAASAMSRAFYKCPTISNIFLGDIQTLADSAMYEACEGSGITGPLDLSSVTTTEYAAFYRAFCDCTNLSGNINLSSLHTVGASAFSYAFYRTKITSLDLSGLTTYTTGFADSCTYCSELISCNFDNLQTISGSFDSAFSFCTKLSSIAFPKLESITFSSACYRMFWGCTSIQSVTFPLLSTISGSNCMRYMFNLCSSLTSLSFPALTSNSFGSYTNQFNNMLGSVTGCTVHFPRSIQRVIGSWSDVTAGFGGTNTTILFDL